MGRFIRGDVVVTLFPYTDLSDKKKRPALVLATCSGSSDIILSQITSQEKKDEYVIELGKADFDSGALRVDSYIRANFVFTADERLPLYKAGHLKQEKVQQVMSKLVELLSKD